MSACTRAASVRAAASGREVDAHASVAHVVEQAAEVAGAGRQVEHGRGLGQPESPDGPSSPTGVEAEGHHPVDHVVAGSDGVEHPPDSDGLLRSDW